ncbi:hypothetical protein MKX03_017245 [Papaver bracteatum]|nr:hypothetical protein MKX03_017245 [Papaver bracteatum]
MEMKLLPQHQKHFNFSTKKLLLCILTLIISYMSMNINCLAPINDDNKSSDRQALIAFKNEITEDPFGILSSWNNKNDSLHFCQWRGVTYSRLHPSRVTGIDLRSQRLVGSISPHIGNLSFLNDLYLSNNSLNGEIPQQIGRLFRLKHLGLSNNSLEEVIPHNITHCSNLIHLNIFRNNLVGSIPNELGYLTNLKMLLLGNNNLSGVISTSLGNLSSSSFTHLRLGNNNLEGRIPYTLSRLTGLKDLALHSNRLSGIVPSPLYNISSLEIFSLLDNQLHGTIPFDIGFTLPNLTYFSVVRNYFSGTIPSSFSNSSRLEYLLLGQNKLVGSVPYNLCSSNSLTWLLLEYNDLGSGKANDLDFLDSIINCASLKYVYLDVNNFGGVLPISIANFTENLDTLNFRDNQLYGSIPTGIQNLLGLTNLHLGSNKFTGNIPPGIGNLQNLGNLGLGTNKFSGSIPSSLRYLTRLINLYLLYNNLTGLIPSSLGNCTSLQNLLLQNNRLSGNIPKQVFQLSSLSITLNLGNNLFTGSLPLEVGNLKNIGVLDLSENKLFGEIPSTIGECLSLTYLNLQGNFFQGNIPPSITFLKGLHELSLSHNNLSGTIPKGFENLTLNGVIPKDGVFKNICAIYIDGNSKLCRGIPDLKLPNCSIPTNPNMEQKLGKSKPVKVIAVILLTLVVLSLYMYWRKKPKTKLRLTTLDVANRYMGVSYNELLKATNGFNDSTNLLRVGSFSSIYKGIIRQDESKPVAVKVLHLQKRGATKSFMAECDALRKVRHRNLLKIVTCCSSTDFQGTPFKALVFEFMVNGSLENWLHPTVSYTHNADQLQKTNLNLERRLSIAIDVASALKYLHHDCESPLVHCDLKPSNVLLDDNLIARVGDFGLAKFLTHTSSPSQQQNEQDASSISIKGSIGYVSPEYGMGGEVSTLGDVYSYGILLLEIPTDDMFKDGLNIHNFSKMHAFPERVLDIVDSRLLLELEGENFHNNETNNFHMQRSQRRNGARHTTRQILASIIQIGVICSSELPSNRINMNKVIVDVQAVKNRFLGI